MSTTSAQIATTSRPGGRSSPALALGLLIGLVGAKLLIHLALGGRYGYFRDELYYLDAGRHLAAGYVDMAPLVAVYAKFALLLGGSQHALRLLPAVAGAAVVALTMIITRQLGGGRFAQGLAGLAALISPAVLVVDNFLSMNAVEPVLWMGGIAVLIRILQTGNSRLWLWFGLLAGLGMENKHSTVFFAIAVVGGLLLTQHRREFLKPWIWLGGLIALLVFLPNLMWQIRHNFPTLEDLENVRRTGTNVVLGPAAFRWQQIFTVHPILLPIWLAGLVSFLRQRATRVLGWTFVVFFVVMFAMHAKQYYLFPIYPMLFAGGAVAFEKWLNRRTSPAGTTLRFAKPVMVAVIVLAAIPVDIFLLPIFPPEKYVRYSGFLHLEQTKSEVHHEAAWPQVFADQFGWQELVQEVAQIYHSLPPQERARTVIMTGNYGEAGAINQFGPKYGLPRAYSGHQNHFFWGPPPFQPETMVILQASRSNLERYFENVQEAGQHYNQWGMAEENGPIWLCRGLKVQLAEVWPTLKHWN